jgi:hypothetical protein
MTTPSGDAVVWSDGAAKSPAGNVELLDAGADEASYAEAWIAASAEYAEQDLVLAGSYFETLDAAAALEQLRRELPAVNSGWPADLFGAIESRKRSAGSPRERRIR